MIDHLTGNSPETKFLETAFGKHILKPDLAKSIVTGSSPTHVITLQSVLGEGHGKGWKAIIAAWYAGAKVPLTGIKFHPGKQTPNPVYKTFTVNTSTDVIAVTAHGYANGDMVIFRTASDGAVLPSPLVPELIYYVVNKTTNDFQVSTTSGGGAVDITSAGSGTLEVWKNDAEQGIDEVFSNDIPHSCTAWARVALPSGVGDFDTKANPPTELVVMAECQTGDTYDNTGSVTASGVYLTNPADVLAFLCKEVAEYANSRIGWASLTTLRTLFDTKETIDFTTYPEGAGLTGSYYTGTAFNTFKLKRIDPAVNFPQSTTPPLTPDLEPNDFSVRFEGKIKFKFTETYTLTLQHDDGVRLYINNMTTPIIDHWLPSSNETHTGTFAATKEVFYDIKLEWYNAVAPSTCILSWNSNNQPMQVIPQDRLYPKNETYKKYECHYAFPVTTSFESALEQICRACNSGYQVIDGKIEFFSYDTLTTPSFTFDETNIKENTFKVYPRFTQQEIMNLPNRFVAQGRDLTSQYLQEFNPQVSYDVQEMQDIAGRIIEETVYVGNCTRTQAIKVLTHYAKLRTSGMICEFEGLPKTLPVLQSDLVRVTHSIANYNQKKFLCLEATDKSIDDNADERIFKLLEWN